MCRLITFARAQHHVGLTGRESLDEKPSEGGLREMLESFYANPAAPEYADYAAFS
jgi:hypothetical protein